ncbi:MAG: D-alanine--D-alanine ligase [Clostridiales bacterium]|nr:D-alanine--D-alanine ligase [Clostridiales bacterium]
MKTKVCVIYGGDSAEREVSEQTAENILGNLDRKKYDVSAVEIPKDLGTDWIMRLVREKPDIVLSALHGGRGENGAVQGLLSCLNIPFTGSGILGSALGINKYYTKTLLAGVHIPTPDSFIVKEITPDFEENLSRLGYPVILKPNCGGASIGVKKCEGYEEARSHAEGLLKEWGQCLCEKFIDGREISCVVNEGKEGLEILLIMDINSVDNIYDYRAKYISEISVVNTSGLPKFMWAMIEKIAKKTFETLDLRGYCCVDMIVKEEQIYVIEVNTLPGFAPNSIITKALKELNIPLSDYLDSLITNALSN